MKKIIILFVTMVSICTLLSSCGDRAGTKEKSSDTGKVFDASEGTESSNTSSGHGELRLLGSPYGECACITENGYYYMTTEMVELTDGSYGCHLMYMDFETGREIYLCSTAGCKHDSPDCPAVFLNDDFPAYSTRIFVLHDNLYILSREYDDDGTMEIFGDEYTEVETKPAALYCAKLDGTERKKIYTFDPELTLEDKVFGDDNGIYIVTKKLSKDKTQSQTYTTSSEQKLMYLDLDSLSMKEVCSLAFDDNIAWSVIGCGGNTFVLSGTDFGRELSQEEMWDDDVYRDLWLNASMVYAVLDTDNGTLREIYRQSNQYYNSGQVLGDSLYVSSSENENIEAYDLGTGEKKTLCSLPQNCIMGTFENTLYCQEWDLSKPTFYFINTETGNITSTPLVNKCNGWPIEFRGETTKDVLFIYDYDATAHGDGSYEIYRNKHALISKEDLFEGRENYREIEMIGAGF